MTLKELQDRGLLFVEDNFFVNLKDCLGFFLSSNYGFYSVDIYGNNSYYLSLTFPLDNVRFVYNNCDWKIFDNKVFKNCGNGWVEEVLIKVVDAENEIVRTINPDIFWNCVTLEEPITPEEFFNYVHNLLYSCDFSSGWHTFNFRKRVLGTLSSRKGVYTSFSFLFNIFKVKNCGCYCLFSGNTLDDIIGILGG